MAKRSAQKGAMHITIEGEVGAETCKCCNHHEVGVVGHDGEGFVPFKPGDMVELTIKETVYEKRTSRCSSSG